MSQIMFLRQMFPESVFENWKMGNMNVKVVKGNDDYPVSKTLKEWLKTALQALDLQMVITLKFVN